MGTLRLKQEGVRIALDLFSDIMGCQWLLMLYKGYKGPRFSPFEQQANRAQTPELSHVLLLPPWG